MTNNYAKAYEPMDKEEQDLINAIENGELKPLPKKEQNEIKKTLKDSLEFKYQKSQPISLRLRKPVLAELKDRAAAGGVNYQTILSALAEQYVNRKIKLEL